MGVSRLLCPGPLGPGPERLEVGDEAGLAQVVGSTAVDDLRPVRAAQLGHRVGSVRADLERERVVRLAAEGHRNRHCVGSAPEHERHRVGLAGAVLGVDVAGELAVDGQLTVGAEEHVLGVGCLGLPEEDRHRSVGTVGADDVGRDGVDHEECCERGEAEA